MKLKLITYSLLFICLLVLKTHAQQLVSIVNQTVSVAPSYTVSNGSGLSISGKVKNTSANSITDFIHVNLAIDTSTTTIPKYYLRSTTSYFKSDFALDSSFAFTVNDIASVANAYKGGSGGTVIIIWAIVGNQTNTVTIADTATTKIYLVNVPAVGMNELDGFEKSSIYFKNPATETINLKYDETVYTKVEIIVGLGSAQPTIINNKTLKVNDLPKGIYLLRFWNENKKIFVIKKVIID